MDKKEYLNDVKLRLGDLPPDIAENQAFNRKRLSKMLVTSSKELLEDKDDDKELIDVLLDTKYRYFNEGYYCELTPEELTGTINEYIEILENMDSLDNG